MSTASSSNVIATDICCGVYVSIRIARKSLLVEQPCANRLATVESVVLVVPALLVVPVLLPSSSAESERNLTKMSRSSSSGSASILSE